MKLDYIPTEQRNDFFSLPCREQERVLFFVPLMVRIDGGEPVSAVARSISSARPHPRGISRPNIIKRYRRWKQVGWRALYDRARVRDEEKTTLADEAERKEFIDFVAGFFEANQRKSKPGYRAFVRHWQSSGAVPGYGTWREYWAAQGHPNLTDCPPDLPPGWTYGNLVRLCQPPKAELKLARVGTAAALEELPSVPGTRDGARFLEYVFFDDVQRDQKIIVPGFITPRRLLQLGCLDYASGVYLRYGLRPELPTDADETSCERLKEKDMKLLVATLLVDFGIPRDYDMHLIVERGTATLRPDDAKALHDLTDGRVKVCYTSVNGGLVLAWKERTSGNARGKAALESWHNLLHNECASIRGQMGKDREHCPTGLRAMEREARALYRAAQVLTPEQRARLRLPFPTLAEAFLQTGEIVARINARTDHNCEGFSSVNEWRRRGSRDQWSGEAELVKWLLRVGATANDAEALIEWRARKESPAERARRLAAGEKFLPFPEACVHRFLDDHQLVRVKRGQISFTVDGKRHVYWPARREDALPEYEQSGEEYLAHYNPLDMGALYLTREHGGFVAAWKQVRVARGDAKALASALQVTRGALKEALDNVRRRGAGQIERALDDAQSNVKLLSEPVVQGRPFTLKP